MDVDVDYERCIGSGVCVFTAPRAFDQRDDGRVLLLEGRFGAESLEAIKDAIASCPTEALSLADSADIDRRLTETGGA